MLDRCVEKAKTQVRVDTLLQYEDFFEAREKLSLM